MKEIKYLNYWSSEKLLSSEAAAVGKWDLWNKTKYQKKVIAGEFTSAQIAEKNHKEKNGYEFTAIEDDEIYCYVTINPHNKHAGVNFIDAAGRTYLVYLFHEMKEDRTLFIREIWYYHFTSETNDNEEYRIHFVFDEQGNVNYRKYDEKDQKFQDFESNKQFDISDLYEPYPEFGKYEGIIRLERNFPVDVIPPNTSPDNTTDLPNGWLPPDWKKS